MKLAICTPTQSSWTPEYGHSLAWLMAVLAKDGGPKHIHHAWVDGTLLHQLRMDLARNALEMGATHILWTDCDMKFQPENVQALLAHDLDIVGCNYLRRLPPHAPTAISLDGKFVAPKSGLEEVMYTGMGLMLTKAEVFRKMEEPWFMQPWDPETKDTVGEDVWFCKRAAETGFKVWVDHDASVGVGHVGKQVLTIERDLVN